MVLRTGHGNHSALGRFGDAVHRLSCLKQRRFVLRLLVDDIFVLHKEDVHENIFDQVCAFGNKLVVEFFHLFLLRTTLIALVHLKVQVFCAYINTVFHFQHPLSKVGISLVVPVAKELKVGKQRANIDGAQPAIANLRTVLHTGQLTHHTHLTFPGGQNLGQNIGIVHRTGSLVGAHNLPGIGKLQTLHEHFYQLAGIIDFMGDQTFILEGNLNANTGTTGLAGRHILSQSSISIITEKQHFAAIFHIIAYVQTQDIRNGPLVQNVSKIRFCQPIHIFFVTEVHKDLIQLFCAKVHAGVKIAGDISPQEIGVKALMVGTVQVKSGLIIVVQVIAPVGRNCQTLHKQVHTALLLSSQGIPDGRGKSGQGQRRGHNTMLPGVTNRCIGLIAAGNHSSDAADGFIHHIDTVRGVSGGIQMGCQDQIIKGVIRTHSIEGAQSNLCHINLRIMYSLIDQILIQGGNNGIVIHQLAGHQIAIKHGDSLNIRIAAELLFLGQYNDATAIHHNVLASGIAQQGILLIGIQAGNAQVFFQEITGHIGIGEYISGACIAGRSRQRDNLACNKGLIGSGQNSNHIAAQVGKLRMVHSYIRCSLCSLIIRIVGRVDLINRQNILAGINHKVVQQESIADGLVIANNMPAHPRNLVKLLMLGQLQPCHIAAVYIEIALVITIRGKIKYDIDFQPLTGNQAIIVIAINLQITILKSKDGCIFAA